MLLMVQKSRSQPPFGCIKPWEITGKTTYWLVNAGFLPSTVSNQPVFSSPVDFFSGQRGVGIDSTAMIRWASPGSHEPTWIIWQDVSSEPKKTWTIFCVTKTQLSSPCLVHLVLNFPHIKLNLLCFSCGFCHLEVTAISEGTLEYPQRVRRAWSQLSKAMALEWVHGCSLGKVSSEQRPKNPWVTWIFRLVPRTSYR